MLTLSFVVFMSLQFPLDCYKLFKRFAHMVENELVEPYYTVVLFILVKSTVT